LIGGSLGVTTKLFKNLACLRREVLLLRFLFLTSTLYPWIQTYCGMKGDLSISSQTLCLSFSYSNSD
jgi:hypothetical protein